MQSRTLDLAGVHNFRDHGGYAVGQSRLRTGSLFRSAQHFKATDSDLDAIGRLGIKSIVDLRSPQERMEFPCRRADDFDSVVLHLGDMPAPDTNAPHVQAARWGSNAAEARAAMQAAYTGMPFRPELLLMFRRYLEMLADSGDPSLIHCLAGKDRTGLAVAVLHRLMGVHADDIMADYLLTNVVGDVEQRIADGAGAIREMLGEAIDDDTIRVVMSVDAAYLDTAMRVIDAVPGGFAGYVHDIIGVEANLRSRLEANLLEG